MGRYNFRPQQVHQATSQLLGTGRLKQPPPWFDTHNKPRGNSKARKPSKLFKPQQITYEEDALRKEFFGDHPWELARPRIVLENDGKDAQYQDWSRITQDRRTIDGESVVQRQMWLMRHVDGMTRYKAYDQARKEFYEERLRQDVERRVAKEEAQATGAYFGKSALEISMELEDRIYKEWKTWAEKEVANREMINSSAYTGVVDDTSVAAPDLITGLEQMDESTIPAGQQGD